MYKAGCKINPDSRPDLEIRLGHQVLTGSHVTRDHGDTLLVRCSDVTSVMTGDHTLLCQDGAWSHSLPHCVQTYQEFNGQWPTNDKYLISSKCLEYAPPRLEWSVSGSVWSVGRVGQLVVRPGSIIHLDCLQDRRRGNPAWSWTHTHKEYPTGA